MKLLMISGDRSVIQGKKGAFYYTLEEFSKHWERIDIIIPTTHYSLLTTNLFGNVFFHPSSRGHWYQPWWIFKKGKELFLEHHHDVMTVHEYPPFYNGLGARWLHKQTNIPYALEVHHIVGYPVASSWKELIGRWMSWAFLKWDAKISAAVRCVNQGTKKTLMQWGLENIEVVPSFYLDREALERCRIPFFETPSRCHGEEIGAKRRSSRTITCVAPQDDTELSAASVQKQYDVIFCGRDVPNKGLKELREATKRIGATLLAIGTDVWLERKEEVYQAMQSGKIFVMNSKSEGGPRALLEAMALGMPVISTRVGIAPDIIEDGMNGIFTTGDTEDLAQDIQMLLDDESLRRRLGGEACKILNRFDRELLMKGYADFLKHL